MPPKRASDSSNNGWNGVYFSLTGWDHNNAVRNHNRLMDFGVSHRTLMVQFRYRVRGGDATRAQWRTASVLLNPPRSNSDLRFATEEAREEWILKTIKYMLMNDYELVNDLMSGKADEESGNILWTDADSGEPAIQVNTTRQVLTGDDLITVMGLVPDMNPRAPSSGRRMYGYLDEQKPQHRAFRYMIEGCDISTLQTIAPDIHINEENHSTPSCDRMCAYKMLADLNTPGHHCKGTAPVFLPENVNKWLNDNGRAVGGLTDGLTTDDIQAHAVHFRYGHCALDLTRSILNLYVPFDRHRHYKTACYVVVGDHCQPIVDRTVVMSIMKTASDRMGRRRITAGYPAGSSNSNDNHNVTDMGIQQTLERRKRRRSLDRVFRPEFEKSEERHLVDQWKDNLQNNADIEIDDWEEDPENSSNHGGTAASPTIQIPDTSDIRKRVSYPLVSETDRFHFFTKENDLVLVEERCKPTYREGDDATKIHYYICTDDDDVEFLYQYLIRVLKIDPLRYARSFNGMCRQIRMQNTLWFASRNIHSIVTLHGHLHPQEPFRPCGLGTYAFRLLHRELALKTRRAGAIWECMSHYPPNLQRLLDTQHPFHRPKLIQRTFQAPYSNPREPSNTNQNSTTAVTTLIPMSQRRRMDLIRSYASTIRNFDRDDMYPIHDPTNQVVEYDEEVHGNIPVGHYLVQIPTEEEIQENNLGTMDDWKILSACLPLGQKRMMSHRMLKNLLQRNLILKNRHIQLVCATDPWRQNKYGRALVEALQSILEKIYKTSDWSENVEAKHFINHLIGLCNGTTVPHSGMRYVFNDIQHLYRLLVTVVSEDQLQRMRIFHTQGHDPLWHRTFDYYELDSSGMSYRYLHLQPIYNVVLEDQAMKIFDVARQIPLSNLININIDAIEYRVPPSSVPPQWAEYLQSITLPVDYEDLSNSKIYDQFMGWFKAEHPKPEEKAMYYYYHYGADHEDRSLHIKTEVKRFLAQQGHHLTRKTHNGAVMVVDPESVDWVKSWKEELRIVRPEVGQSHATVLNVINTMFTEEKENRGAGLLVTGPAGTGKTYCIRSLQQFAVNIGCRVVLSAYTHAACVQMGPDAVTLCSLFGVDEKADVRAMMATSRKFAAQLRALEIDVLIIDEISMIPLHLLEILLLFHRVSSQTRICCFGDFNQLPPVEPGWERGESFSFFDHTDIFPYLLYDRVRNVHGQWIQLHECMRTQDPLLVRICQDPTSVTTIQPSDFPMPSMGIPIWRFISWRNATRKACNWYCMHRYLQAHPDVVNVRLSLVDLYVERKLHEQQRKNQTNPVVTLLEENQTSNNNATGRFNAEYFRTQFYSSSVYKPAHWRYLQQCFVYAVGMEVVCRNTMKQWDNNNAAVDTKGDNTTDHQTSSSALVCVNNRRGIIIDISVDQRTITVDWLDARQKMMVDNNNASSSSSSSVAVTLTFYDFAFNFVPGFCITAHMAQGETIREHYGILEWSDIAPQVKMAYVAVTRGSTSSFLHIPASSFADPWNTSQDTSNLRDNILRKMYHNFKWDKEATFAVDIDDVIHQLQSVQTELCAECKVPLVTTKFNPYKPPAECFMLSGVHSVSSLAIVCTSCYHNTVMKKRNTNSP